MIQACELGGLYGLSLFIMCYFNMPKDRKQNSIIQFLMIIAMSLCLGGYSVHRVSLPIPWFLHDFLFLFIVALYIFIMYKINIESVFFFSLIYYLTTDCVVKALRHANMVWFGVDYVASDSISIVYFLELVLMGIIAYIIYKTICSLFSKTNQYITKTTLIISVIMCIPVFLIGHIESWMPIEETSVSIWVSIVRLVAGFSALLAILGMEYQYRSVQQTQEITNLQLLINQQYEQYKLKKETIDELNQKAHDLKHQMYGLKLIDDEMKKEYIDKMMATVSAFDSTYQTGNEILDVVLNEKSVVCQEKKINFACVVQPGALDFLQPLDVSTIVSNALDNAIEGVESCEEEKRIIRLRVKAENNFVTMRFENYYQGELNENFKTTKGGSNHGYGLKGIKLSVDKYGGNMTITTDNKWFILTILFPLGN